MADGFFVVVAGDSHQDVGPGNGGDAFPGFIA